MPQPGQEIHLPVNNQLVRLVNARAFQKFVNGVYPTKQWKFPFGATPVFVPDVSEEPCKICEEAVSSWLGGGAKHYQVSPAALIRHLGSKGLIPTGHYLFISNPESYGERIKGGMSDVSTHEGDCKGVF